MLISSSSVYSSVFKLTEGSPSTYLWYNIVQWVNVHFTLQRYTKNLLLVLTFNSLAFNSHNFVLLQFNCRYKTLLKTWRKLFHVFLIYLLCLKLKQRQLLLQIYRTIENITQSIDYNMGFSNFPEDSIALQKWQGPYLNRYFLVCHCNPLLFRLARF